MFEYKKINPSGTNGRNSGTNVENLGRMSYFCLFSFAYQYEKKAKSVIGLSPSKTLIIQKCLKIQVFLLDQSLASRPYRNRNYIRNHSCF